MNTHRHLLRALIATILFVLCAVSSLRATEDHYGALMTTATHKLKEGALADARRLANAAAVLEPERFEAYLLNGVAAHRQEKDDEARPLLEKARVLAPADVKPDIEQFLAKLASPQKSDAAKP